MPNLTPHVASENQMLAALPHEEYKRLHPHMELVALPRGKTLYNAGDRVTSAYFVMRGLLSLISTTEEGAQVEVGMVGKEGMVGIPILLNAETSHYRVLVQVAGVGMKIKAGAFREEFLRGGCLQDLMLRYIDTVLMQITQSAVCNRFHTTEQRLSRWLLVCRDRLNSNYIPLTQEFISHMLGAPRTSVTSTASALQKEKLITYTRGKITILDGESLEARSCECYRVVKKVFKNVIAA